MRVTKLCTLLFASISVAFSFANEFDLGNQPITFRVLRGKKHSAKQNKSREGKKVGRPARGSTSGADNVSSDVSDNICPEQSPVVGDTDALCSMEGQICTFTYEATSPDAICTNRDECKCTNGKWDCNPSIGCVSANPPFIIACPAESPLVTNETTCDAEHQEDPCTFEYSTTSADAICTNTDVCSCTIGTWDCNVRTIGCVSANPPFIIACPAESPLVTNETTCDAEHQEDPCTFEYSTTSADAICTNTDICSCTSGTWDCNVRTIGCVSANPPFIIACPAESPLVTNETTCDAEHQEDPCTFEYSTTSADAICTNTDVCSCSSGAWDCNVTTIECVSANPPSIGSRTP
ncbi:hypothetical protein MHU86_6697 [Fragilaria crotonensis]|nr:hypothetical protein MHU86_6697 [Fragilaria crotonensis]